MHKTRFIGGTESHRDPIRPAFWYPPALPDDKETTLILAGDLWIGTAFIEYCGFSWIREVACQFKQVIIVLGNHDYWPGNNSITIKAGAKKCREMLLQRHIYNVHILDADTFEDEGILFVGATLWTDMNKSDPLTMMSLNTYMAYDGKCAYETGPGGAWSRFTAEKWVSTHHKHLDYIKHVVEQNRDKQIVVITHHIPLTNLSDPSFSKGLSDGYYSSDLSGFILDNEHISHWFYGHTHFHRDEMFGNTRLINNCVGYTSQHFEQEGLVKHEVIKL